MEEIVELDEVDELAPTMQEFVMPEMSNVYVSAPDYEEEVVVASFEEELISEEIVLADFNETFEEEEIAEVFELNMEEESTPVYNTEFVLNKPVNIYAESELEMEAEAEEVDAVVESVTEVAYDITAEVVVAADTENLETSFRSVEMEMEEEPTMQLVMREASIGTSENRPHHSSFDISMDNSEEQRRKVAERIQKLRNLEKSESISDGSKHLVFKSVDQLFGLNLLNHIAQKDLSLEAQKLLAQRAVARESGDFSQSDRLRNELEKLGVAVKDGKSGQSWDWIIN